MANPLTTSILTNSSPLLGIATAFIKEPKPLDLSHIYRAIESKLLVELYTEIDNFSPVNKYYNKQWLTTFLDWLTEIKTSETNVIFLLGNKKLSERIQVYSNIFTNHQPKPEYGLNGVNSIEVLLTGNREITIHLYEHYALTGWYAFKPMAIALCLPLIRSVTPLAIERMAEGYFGIFNHKEEKK